MGKFARWLETLDPLLIHAAWRQTSANPPEYKAAIDAEQAQCLDKVANSADHMNGLGFNGWRLAVRGNQATGVYSVVCRKKGGYSPHSPPSVIDLRGIFTQDNERPSFPEDYYAH